MPGVSLSFIKNSTSTGFSALSVREKRGQVLLREAAGRDARVVLDPTLLLTGEDWGELAAAGKLVAY